MTERRQKIIANCLRLFSVLDQLDEIGDSDYDNDNSLRRSKCRQNVILSVEENIPAAKTPKKLRELTDQKCASVWNPSKGLIDGQNPLEVMSNEQFVKVYRFSKECIEDILQMISYGLSKFTNRGKPYSPMMQLLITLQFLTTGMEMLLYAIVLY